MHKAKLGKKNGLCEYCGGGLSYVKTIPGVSGPGSMFGLSIPDSRIYVCKDCRKETNNPVAIDPSEPFAAMRRHWTSK